MRRGSRRSSRPPGLGAGRRARWRGRSRCCRSSRRSQRRGRSPSRPAPRWTGRGHSWYRCHRHPRQVGPNQLTGQHEHPAEPYPAPRYGSGGLLEIERGGDDVLREAVHIGVVASAGQDGHIAGRHDSPALTLQRPGDDSGTALGPAFRYQSVDERDDLAGSRTAICLLIPRWYRIGIASSAEGRRRTGA